MKTAVLPASFYGAPMAFVVPLWEGFLVNYIHSRLAIHNIPDKCMDQTRPRYGVLEWRLNPMSLTGKYLVLSNGEFWKNKWTCCEKRHARSPRTAGLKQGSPQGMQGAEGYSMSVIRGVGVNRSVTGQDTWSFCHPGGSARVIVKSMWVASLSWIPLSSKDSRFCIEATPCESWWCKRPTPCLVDNWVPHRGVSIGSVLNHCTLMFKAVE